MESIYHFHLQNNLSYLNETGVVFNVNNLTEIGFCFYLISFFMEEVSINHGFKFDFELPMLGIL